MLQGEAALVCHITRVTKCPAGSRYNLDVNWTRLRTFGWPTLFNCAAVFVCVKAAYRAFAFHDFTWAITFALIAVAFLFGSALLFSQHRLAGPVNHRLQAGGIYLFTALTNALTVDDFTFMAQAGGRPYSGWPHALMNLSMFGSLTLCAASFASFIKPRYGYVIASVGATLSWPYFGYLSWNLPWRDFVFLVTIHWDGELQVTAIGSLAIASVYSLMQLRGMWAKPMPATGALGSGGPLGPSSSEL